MFLMGPGALLVFGEYLYMARTAIWRGGVRFLGLGTNWTGHSPYGNRCNSVSVGGQFLAFRHSWFATLEEAHDEIRSPIGAFVFHQRICPNAVQGQGPHRPWQTAHAGKANRPPKLQ